MHPALRRADAFARRLGLKVPVLLAPMAGACPPSLSVAVANTGGLGACGVLLMQPSEIAEWVADFRRASAGVFQLNTWCPDPPPVRNPAHEARVSAFLAEWGPPIPPGFSDVTPPDFAAQCQAMLDARPPIISSVMGFYPPAFVAEMKRRGIIWFANIATVAEARAAEAAGADVIVAQGTEGGGHRGTVDIAGARDKAVGLFSLLPAVVDAVKVPVIATGGIADARGVAAALLLGASAVQIGTGFLRCPEANLHPAWADALARTPPEGTIISRVFSGRYGRSIATSYVCAAMSAAAPPPAAYPVQRGLTAPMRAQALKTGDVERMQAWAGQSCAMAEAIPAAQVVAKLWGGAGEMLN